MPFVIDASVALAWHFRDESSEYADRVQERLRDGGVAAPSIWPLEVANALLVAERRGRLSPAEASHVAELILEVPVSIHEAPAELALGPVLDLGRAQGLTAYDAAYLDLAMREGLPLATQDEALRAAARRVGVPLVD